MAFSEFEQFRIEKAIDAFMKQRRPRPDIRHEFDLSAKIELQSLVLYELRPDSELLECLLDARQLKMVWL